MQAPPRRRQALLGAVAVILVLVVAAVVALVLNARSGPVEVASAPRDGDPACVSAAARFPATVSGLAARGTNADGATQAWGDPPVIARCGVPALAPTEIECIEVDRVGWIPQPLSDGTRFTSFGTDPALEVLVPKAYAPEPMLLPAFTDAAKQLPGNGRLCR
jgi:hypothetical protein